MKIPYDPIKHKDLSKIREGTVYDHVISALKGSRSNDPVTNLAILFHDVAKSQTYKLRDVKGKLKHTYYGHDSAGVNIIEHIARRLNISEEDKKAMQFAASRHMLAHNPDRVRDSKLASIVNSPYWNVLKDVVYADEMSRPAPVGSVDRVLKAIEYMETSKDRIKVNQQTSSRQYPHQATS